MTREEFVKQRCEIDKITEEEFEKTYRVVDCNCGAYYCKGYRCLDLDDLLKENQKYKKVIDKAIEYITSYESISTIQGLTYIEANKQLDEKTMTEMTNRYLLVHDKLLDILKEVSE